MRHEIDANQQGARASEMLTAIEQCVHCGFCLAACPTYRILGEEMDSPRGRIYLMKSVMEKQITEEQAQPYIDRCLGCLGCVPACPSGVQYGDLLTSYRANTEKDRSRSLLDSIARTLVCETLPYPSRFRLAVRAGVLGRFFQSVLPDQIGAMIGMIPDKLPPNEMLPAFFPAKGERRARVALLTGCVQQVLDPDINMATLRVLAENGVETIIPSGQGCCGSLMMHIGEDQRAKELASNNLRIFTEEVDAIITNAAGCGSGMHEYDLLFAGDPQREKARQFADKVQDITVFLDHLGIRTPQGFAKPVTAVYQDACHLLHAQGIKNPPRNLLNAIPNLTLKELSDGGLCCGSAGTYNLEQPEIAQELGQRKAAQILATKADLVISGNIGCLTQIQAHLGEKLLPVRHTIQVLDSAYRGSLD